MANSVSGPSVAAKSPLPLRGFGNGQSDEKYQTGELYPNAPLGATRNVRELCSRARDLDDELPTLRD